MSGVTCNKCKSSKPSEGDSWCLGCSSLEVSQLLFKKRWQVPGLRGIAEESALSCARYVRALHNLDSSQGAGPAGTSALQTAPKRKAARERSRSPRRERDRSPSDHRPPLRRSVQPREREAPEGVHHNKRPDSDYEYTEESEEEEELEREEVVKEEEDHRRDRRRGEKPPEPNHPPPHPKKKKKKGKGAKRRRGGTRHQKHYREREDPCRRSHRRLDQERLELADNLQAGLERRA